MQELQNAGDNLKVSLLAKETAIARVERERDLLKERLTACEGSNSGELRLIADDAREQRTELQRLKGLLERTRFALDQKRSDLGLLLAQIQDAELKIEELRAQVALRLFLFTCFHTSTRVEVRRSSNEYSLRLDRCRLRIGPRIRIRSWLHWRRRSPS